MFLDEIVEATRRRLNGRGCQRPVAELALLSESAPPPRDFIDSLRQVPFAIIAEIKRASPSKGWLRRELSPPELARSYERGGAAALSVLTEPRFFRGSPDDLVVARGAVGLPVLCKDFVLDERQLYEARLWGADAVLLIAAILAPGELAHLIEVAHSLSMAALVEAHDQAEVEAALTAGARLVGVNNRNLTDFTVDLETTLRLRPLVPPGVMVVSESGIRSAADLARLREAGVHAALVGESLVTSPDPEAQLRELLEGSSSLSGGDEGKAGLR
ncbi:MAG: indole-3-glycerol phosphate synthase TrpC [Dehalococcoidia bacterium]